MPRKSATPPGVLDETKPKTDWESIERDFRANVLSIREVAKLHDVSEGAIRKKAKGDPSKGIPPWERDLTSKVNAKVRSELVRTEVRTANTQEKVRTEREIVESAAAMVVQVVRDHRAGIRNGRDVVGLLMNQLTDVAGKRDEFEAAIELECEDDKTNKRRTMLMKAVSIPAHAATVRDLSTAMKNLVYLERQAFNITGGEDEPPPPGGDPAKEVKDGFSALRAAFEKHSGKPLTSA